MRIKVIDKSTGEEVKWQQLSEELHFDVCGINFAGNIFIGSTMDSGYYDGCPIDLNKYKIEVENA